MNTNYANFLIIVLMIYFSYLLINFLYSNYSSNKNNYTKLLMKNIRMDNSNFIAPVIGEKNLFIYWKGPKFNLIQILIKLIYLHSNYEQNYKIFHLSDQNLGKFLPEIPIKFQDLIVQHKADYIRIHLIHNYGGIWLDTDTIVMSDLNMLFDNINDKSNGFFITENDKYIWNGVFGSKPNTQLFKKIIDEMNTILSKNSNLDWSDIGPQLLTNIYKTNKSLFNTYKIYNGLDNMYPVNWDKCVVEYIDKDYSNYTNIIRKFQPIVVLVNSVYKKINYMTIDTILNQRMPLNYFLTESFKKVRVNVHSIDYKFNKTFNCLIATTGRKSLQHMINSITHQLLENDCLTIVYDGYSSIPYFDLSNAKCKVVQYFEPKALGFWGHGIRNKYATLIEHRDFVVHADDDDEYTSDAFEYLRNICNDDKVLYVALFNHGIKKYGSSVKEGSIGTPCGIIPYDFNMSSKWLDRVGGDGAFYEDLKAKFPVVLLNHVIYTVRPQKQ